MCDGKLNPQQASRFIEFAVSQAAALAHARMVCLTCGRMSHGRTMEHEGWCPCLRPHGRKATCANVQRWEQQHLRALEKLARHVAHERIRARRSNTSATSSGG